MRSVCFVFGLLFVSVSLCTTARGGCAEPNNLDRQIAERTKQYHESLRQRAQQFSPSLQSKIELQAQRSVAKDLKKWEKGEINVQVALPDLAESSRMARFVARHLPFSSFPAGSFGFSIGQFNAVLTVTSVQYVPKVLTILSADSPIIRHSSVGLFRQSDGVLSYFVRIVGSIVQRR